VVLDVVLQECLVVKQLHELRRKYRSSRALSQLLPRWQKNGLLEQPSPSSQLNAALPQAVNVNSLADGTALPMKRMICCCESGQLAVSAVIPAS